MGTSRPVTMEFTENCKTFPDLNGFDLESMVISDIKFDLWKKMFYINMIEHDDEEYFVTCLSRFIAAWMKRDNEIWQVKRVCWGGLEDYVFGENFNPKIHGIFPNKKSEDGEGYDLISDISLIGEFD